MTTGKSRTMSGALAMATLAVFWGVRAAWSQTPPAEDRTPVEVTARDYTFDPATGQGHGEGNVRVRYQDVSLDADVVDVNLKTKDVSAKGNVVLRREPFEWRGDAVSGNVGTKKFVFGTFEFSTGVWYGTGSGGGHESDGSAWLQGVRMSTCDLPRPHYSIQARRVLYYPDGKFRAYHTVYRVGELPIFYWPVVFGDSNPGRGSISIRPGYSSDWGAFLLLARTWQVSKEVETTAKLDLRSKHGVAIGNETHIRRTYSSTDLDLYGMYDTNPPETGRDRNGRFDTQDWRGRAALYHRQELDRALTLRTNVDAQSDVDMLHDWFKRDYDRDPQPRTFADVVYDTPRLSLSVVARPRVNDFETVVESLPELRLEMPRQVLFAGMPFLYQSTTTAGYYKMNWREFDIDRPAPLTDPEDYDSFRLDSLHMVYAPFSVAEHIQVVPRAGVRLTHYSDSSDTEMRPADIAALYDVDDPYRPRSTTVLLRDYDDEGGSLTRLAGELGLELSTKFSRTWTDYMDDRMYLDGLRHIVQPYVNYTFAPDPSEDRENIYFFDAVDRLTEQNFVRVGVDQRVQTRRDQRIYTLARIQSYADFHFSDKNDNDQGYDGLGDLGNKLEFSPTDALKTWLTVVADLDEMDVRRAELGLRHTRLDGVRFTLAYLYRDAYVPRSTASMGSSLVDLTGEHGYLVREYQEAQTILGEVFIPVNEGSAMRLRLEYDLEESEFTHQVFEILRDLHCWVGSLALEDDNGDRRIMVMLYLKAYPDTRIDLGI